MRGGQENLGKEAKETQGGEKGGTVKGQGLVEDSKAKEKMSGESGPTKGKGGKYKKVHREGRKAGEVVVVVEKKRGGDNMGIDELNSQKRCRTVEDAEVKQQDAANNVAGLSG